MVEKSAESVERPLTDRQAMMLRAINDWWRQHYQSPSVRDLMRVTGIASPNGIQCHLAALERKGYLFRPKVASGECASRGLVTIEVREALVDGLKSL